MGVGRGRVWDVLVLGGAGFGRGGGWAGRVSVSCIARARGGWGQEGDGWGRVGRGLYLLDPPLDLRVEGRAYERVEL